MRRTEDLLTLNQVERSIFSRTFRGKLRLAGVYSALTGLTRNSFEGIAVGSIGRFEVDTAHHEDWAMIFGGMEHAHLRWALRECAGAERVWDVGAHHGFYTVALARIVDEVHAFEPFPESAERIRRNVELNDVRATVHEVAVSDKSGRAHLLLSVDGPQNHSIVGHRPSGATVEVDTSTLDELAARLGIPAFVKIDVEGAEAAVFRGATQLFAEQSTTFLFERERWHSTREEAHALLRDAGYTLTSLVRGKEVDGTNARMLVARPVRFNH